MSARTIPQSPGHAYHLDNARAARAAGLRYDPRRPDRAVALTPAAPLVDHSQPDDGSEDWLPGCDFHGTTPRHVTVAEWLARGVIPWRHLLDAEVQAACSHAQPRIRARARREYNRRTYGK